MRRCDLRRCFFVIGVVLDILVVMRLFLTGLQEKQVLKKTKNISNNRHFLKSMIQIMDIIRYLLLNKTIFNADSVITFYESVCK